MPTGKNWTAFILLNVGFILYLISVYFFSSVKDIKENWPKYRCNPMYMPLSDNIQQDFVYCIQNMQSDYMGYILQPITFATSSLTNLAGNFSNELQNIRGMFSQTRSFISNIIESIFGVFLNIIIEFQKIIMGIKDLIGKVVGILTVILYLLDGSVKTVNSMWNGPNGQLVRSLGNCFHPNTILKLKNGTHVKMSKINVGVILENGSKVISVMKLSQDKTDIFYKLYDNINNIFIFVTGTHMVLLPNGQYGEVQTHPYAIVCPEIKASYLSCLITNDHKIKIGNYLFWDYEDRSIRKL